MSWFQRLFGRARQDVVTIRDRDVAERFPVQTPLHTRGPTLEEAGRCGCGGRFETVLVTTGGADGDRELWRDHPVALDGLRCRKCDKISVPRSLEPDEIGALNTAAAGHVDAGRLDEAELALRRMCTSWPGFAPGRYNLALLHRRRADAEELGHDRPLVRGRLLDIAESHLRDALRGQGMPVGQIVGELVEVLLRREAEGAALEVIAEAQARADLEDSSRAILGDLTIYVRKRLDLQNRGVAAVKSHLIHDDGARQTSSADRRRHLERGLDLLARHLRRNPGAWQAAWFAGKAHQALGDREQAMRDFAQAYAIQPQEPEVGREYCFALLLAPDPDHALARSVAETACAARPDDAGLVANLALAHLLAGQLDQARTIIARALALDPRDRISHDLARRIDQVVAGDRPQPRTLAELERS